MNIGGLFKSLINPATLMQLAMGPAGWASIMAKAVFTAVAQQVIQQIGQKLGLPPAMIAMAQQAFAQASGQPGLGQTSIQDTVSQMAEQFGLSAVQQGVLQRGAFSASKSIVESMMRQMQDEAEAAKRKSGAAVEDGAAAEVGATSGNGTIAAGVASGGNFLRAIAMALGAAADQKMQEMATLANQIKDQTASNSAFANGLGKDPSNGDLTKAQANSQKLGSMTSLFQAVSQELSILQNVIKSVLESVGQAQSTVARKS